MQIFIKTLQSKTITADVDAEDTVEGVKRKIEATENLPVGEQRLIYFGKQLDDSRTLSEYNIKDQDTLHLIMRMVGGL